MKQPIEWLNEVGETVSTSMFSRQKPPGVEVEALIKRIQEDAIKEWKEEAVRLRDAATTLIRYKNQRGQDSLWNNLANAANDISALAGSPGR